MGNEFCIPNRLSGVFSNAGERQIHTIDLKSIHDEADNRIILHAHNIIKRRYYSAIVRTGDSDVLVILLGFLEYFLLKQPELKVYVEIKTSGSARVINVKKYYSSLEKNICNTLSSFFKISKKEWFSHWLKFPEHEKLGSQHILIRFVVFAFLKKKTTTLMNCASCFLIKEVQVT